MSGAGDAGFAGSIPALYQRNLEPLLFAPYALEVAKRVADWAPRRVLETAAGTGIVTRAIRQACPQAEIVATDLNQAMLDIAEQSMGDEGTTYRAADAQALPFGDANFDAVVCQFGVMFFPDRVAGNREAWRVLRPGGRYLLAIWDGLDRNPLSASVQAALEQRFPEDPPKFLDRTPFGYHQRDRIEADLRAGGFRDIAIETVAARGATSSARDAAEGLVAGTPLRAEIEARAPHGLETTVDAVAERLSAAGEIDTSLSALIVTARKD